jgi:hypothetical protein
MKQPNCTSLGVCQSRKPACQGCNWSFAPGSIEGPFTRAQHRHALKWTSVFAKVVLALALLACLSVVLGFFLGYLGAHHG